MEIKHIEMKNSEMLPHVGRLIAEGHTVTMNVKGYSMRPFLEHERDKVTLAAPTDLRVGDAILAEIRPGCYVLHRIIAINGPRITLMGDGNLRGVEHCTAGHVLGRVTHYISPRRTVEATDGWLRFKIRLWRWLRPLRRYLLFIYRKLYRLPKPVRKT